MTAPTLFTRIINGDIPATIVYRDEALIAIRDINPQAPTHILIIPIKPLPSLEEAEAGDAHLLGQMLLTAKKIAAQEGLAESGYRLVINTRGHGGQTVPHLHLHLLGGRQMTWPPG